MSLVFLILQLCGACAAQTWTPFPHKLGWAVYCLYSDTAQHTLYLGGIFNRVDADTVYSIVGWNGTDTVHLSQGLRYRAFQNGAYVNRVMRYQDNLYAGGNFDQAPANADSMRGLAKWNGAQWDSVFNPPSGGATSLDVFDDTLFISGTYNFIHGQFCGGVAAYHNNQVVNCYGSFPDPDAHYIAGTVKYQNELYAFGHILDTLGQLAICRWNPALQTWDRVNDAFLADLDATVSDAVVFNDELYVCGDFSSSVHVPGQHVMKWDGNQWHAIGNLDAAASDLEVYNGMLYVAGWFNSVDGLVSPNVIAFDGVNWHQVNDQPFDGPVYTMAFFNDEMWVGGNFQHAGPDSVAFVARYNLPLTAGGNTVRVEPFAMFPNPTGGDATAIVSWHSPERATLQVVNSLGQVVNRFPVNLNRGSNRFKIDMAELPSGVYAVCLIAEGAYVSHKLVIE